MSEHTTRAENVANNSVIRVLVLGVPSDLSEPGTFETGLDRWSASGS